MTQDNEEEVMVDVAKTFGSLSIDMVEFEEQKARGTGLPPFLWGQILDNWTAVELPVVFKLSNELWSTYNPMFLPKNTQDHFLYWHPFI